MCVCVYPCPAGHVFPGEWGHVPVAHCCVPKPSPATAHGSSSKTWLNGYMSKGVKEVGGLGLVGVHTSHPWLSVGKGLGRQEELKLLCF